MVILIYVIYIPNFELREFNTLIFYTKQSSSGTSGDSSFFEETGEPKAYMFETKIVAQNSTMQNVVLIFLSVSLASLMRIPVIRRQSMHDPSLMGLKMKIRILL